MLSIVDESWRFGHNLLQLAMQNRDPWPGSMNETLLLQVN